MIWTLIDGKMFDRIVESAGLPVDVVKDGLEVVFGEFEDENDAINYIYMCGARFVGGMVRDSYNDAHAN